MPPDGPAPDRTPRGWRAWTGLALTRGQVVGAVAIVLVLAELWARAVGPYLPPSELGDAPEMALKRDQLVERGATDVVLLGNSMVDHGLDPATLAAEADLGTTYNAALAGAPLVGIERWATDHVVPRTHPGTLVLGLHPISLIDANPIDGLTGGTAGAAASVIENTFLGALDRLEPSPLDRADERVGDVSALVRHRTTLRNPRDAARGTWAFVSGHDPGEGVERVAPENGVLVARDEAFWRRYLTPEGFATQIGERRDEAIAQPDQVDQLEDLLADARFDRTGVRHLLRRLDRLADRVVLVIMPMAPGMVAALGDDADLFDEGVGILAAAAAAVDAEVIDLRVVPGLDDGHFADPAHLNVPGAEVLTAALAARL